MVHQLLDGAQTGSVGLSDIAHIGETAVAGLHDAGSPIDQLSSALHLLPTTAHDDLAEISNPLAALPAAVLGGTASQPNADGALTGVFTSQAASGTSFTHDPLVAVNDAPVETQSIALGFIGTSYTEATGHHDLVGHVSHSAGGMLHGFV